jgi:hypothetical protein
MSIQAFSSALDAVVADNTAGHANFTQTQKDMMMAWAPTACAFMGQLRQLALMAETLNTQWTGGVSQAVGFLNNNVTLPNPTDLAGVNSLLHPTDATSDWQVIADCCKQLLALNGTQINLAGDTPLATMVRAAGINVQG